MLLPVTSSMNWLARRPEMAEKSERSMDVSCSCECCGVRSGVRARVTGVRADAWGGWCGCCRASGAGAHLADAGDAVEGHVGPVYPQHRPVAGEADRRDGAGLLGTVGAGVGHAAADEAAGPERELCAERLGRLVRDVG